MSLAWPWQQGKRGQGVRVPRPRLRLVHRGFDNADLQEAEELLEELGEMRLVQRFVSP